MKLFIPRDRNGEFEPVLAPKHQRRERDLRRKSRALYARGLSTQDISVQLEELYGAQISAALISEVTDRLSTGRRIKSNANCLNFRKFWHGIVLFQFQNTK